MDAGLIRNNIKPELGHVMVKDVNRAQVQALHAKMKASPYMANRAIALVSKMMNLAEVWNLRPDGSNPVRHVKRFPEKPREVFLDKPELRKLARVIENHWNETAKLAIKLIMFTGCRKNEIVHLKWENVKLDERLIYLSDSKTGENKVFLSEEAVKLIQQLRPCATGTYLFEAYDGTVPKDLLRSCWRRITENAGLQGIRIHDLRHLYGSLAHEIGGGSQRTVATLLRHKQLSTTERYIHHHNAEVRATADKTGSALASMFDPD
jgi:integrase